MNLAGQIDKLVQRGFSEERAETIVLMREAAILLFDAFPEMLVVVGGANLGLFQEGVRHSAGLDFFPVAGELPEIASLTEVLSNGLKPLGELLNLSPLNLDTLHAASGEVKMMLSSNSGKALFTVDITRIGSVLKSGIEELTLAATGVDRAASIKFVEREPFHYHRHSLFLPLNFSLTLLHSAPSTWSSPPPPPPIRYHQRQQRHYHHQKQQNQHH